MRMVPLITCHHGHIKYFINIRLYDILFALMTSYHAHCCYLGKHAFNIDGNFI